MIDPDAEHELGADGKSRIMDVVEYVELDRRMVS
jgi:hypothetical protein